MRSRGTRTRRCPVPGRGGDERGAIAVELALVLPLLIITLLGTVTAGLSYSHGLGLTNAVREGARFGATADSTSATWAQDVIQRTRQTQLDDNSSPKETSICVDLVKQGGGGKPMVCEIAGGPALGAGEAPAVPANVTAGTCVVRVWAARNFEIVTGVTPTISNRMLRSSVAQYERKTC